MRKASIVVLVLALLLPMAAGAQIVSEGRWLFDGAVCPTGWAPLTPSEMTPASPPRYRVALPNGPRITMSTKAVMAAFTIAGTLDQAAFDAAVAAGDIVLFVGYPAQIRCSWRPVGGTP